MISKKTILLLALGTLVVFGGLGIVIVPFVRDINVGQFLLGNNSYLIQILVGVGFGFITAKAGWQIVQLPIMKDTKVFFSGMIKPIGLNVLEIVFISLCAGIGEELFFRGAIQPILGVWFTAILFVLLHGYLNPFNLPLTYYGVYMVLVIGVMGLMTEYFGILSAMISHTLIDIILLWELSNAPLPDDEEITS